MARAPIPKLFPGDFFVLTFDRDVGRFILHVDDDKASTYDMGSTVHAVLHELMLRGFNESFRESAVDYAREFGGAQCIPKFDRVVQILPRQAMKPPRLQFNSDSDSEQNGWLPALP